MNIELMKLEFDEEELEKFLSNKIGHKKEINKIISKSRQNAKLGTCYYCNKSVKGFCNSHSVPAFTLRNIAVNGEVYFSNAFVESPLMGIQDGVNKSGTFKIICRECDSKVFNAYENPDAYTKELTSLMLAQIAMKNYLKLISKRLIEREIYTCVKELNPLSSEFVEHNYDIQNLDLNEAINGFKKAKRACNKGWDGEYYLFCYEKLDYVVPIAFQSAITLVTDLEGRVVNDIYNLSQQYVTQDIQIAVFPLEESSVVIMFMDSTNKRYRKFCKMFKKLTLEERLGIINYIIFLYSEDVFISKEIPADVLNNQRLKDISKQTPVAVGMFPIFEEPISRAKEVYDLKKWKEIPNLLSEVYEVR